MKRLNNKVKKVKEVKEPSTHCLRLDGIYGIAMAFVVVSIAFTSYIVFTGVEGYLRLVVVPQLGFAAWVVLYKFSQR